MATENTPDRILREFDRSLPMTLLAAREAVMRKFLPALRAHDLSAQQWRVLRALNEVKSMDASEIAARCAILMPSLSRILKNLENRKLIRRKNCPEDQRRSLISIANKGSGLVERIAPVSEERYDEIERRFGKKNLANLYDMLGELIDCLEDK